MIFLCIVLVRMLSQAPITLTPTLVSYLMTADLQSLKSSKFSKYKETHYKMPVDSWGHTGNNPTWCEDGGKVNFMLKYIKNVQEESRYFRMDSNCAVLQSSVLV